MDDPHTSPEAAEVQRRVLRRMTPTQRYERGRAMRRLGLEFMRAGIRMRHPDYTREQVEMALARLVLGDEDHRRFRRGWPRLDH